MERYYSCIWVSNS